ncbi:MAG: hypothetical protein Q4B54_08025 [Coriobacteriales bacterium]|nr:hypothetical protein [Coriobacteriales bacterium]
MKHVTRAMLVSALSLGLVATPLAACGNRQSADSIEIEVSAAPEVDLSSLKTMGDVLSVEGATHNEAYNQTTYLHVLNTYTKPIRAVTKITPEIAMQLDDADAEAMKSRSGYWESVKKVLGHLKLTSVEDLSAKIPAQSELDTYVGKTGQDLLDDGFTFLYLSAYGVEMETEADLVKGDFVYRVTFWEHISIDFVYEDDKIIRDLPIKSIRYLDLSNDAMDPSQF